MHSYVSWNVSQNHFVCYCQQFVDDFLRNYERTTFQIGSILTDSWETIYQNSISSLLTLHDLSIMLDFLHFPSITSKKCLYKLRKPLGNIFVENGTSQKHLHRYSVMRGKKRIQYHWKIINILAQKI